MVAEGCAGDKANAPLEQDRLRSKALSVHAHREATLLLGSGLFAWLFAAVMFKRIPRVRECFFTCECHMRFKIKTQIILNLFIRCST